MGESDIKTFHICFVALDYPSRFGGGGVGTQVQTLAQALTKRGCSVTVIDLHRDDKPLFEMDGLVAIHRVQPNNLHWYISKLPVFGEICTLAVREIEYSWSVFRKIQYLSRQPKPIDIIEGTETGSFLVALFLRRVPMVVRLHGEQFTFARFTPPYQIPFSVRLSRWFQRLSMQFSAMLISPSASHAREIERELGQQLPPVRVIPNSINCIRFGLDDDGDKNPHLILYVGRLQKVKGVEVLLDAVPMIVNKCADTQVILAGSQHPSITLQELHTENVTFVGHVPREQLSSLYKQASIVVIPSFYESFGLVALEEMCQGVPIIASSTGGLVAIIENGVNGCLVPPGDPQALANAAINLLSAPAFAARLGRNGLETVSMYFKLEHILERNLVAYQSVLT